MTNLKRARYNNSIKKISMNAIGKKKCKYMVSLLKAIYHIWKFISSNIILESQKKYKTTKLKLILGKKNNSSVW